MKKRNRLMAAAIFMFMALGGCAADLSPAPAANKVAGMEEAARSTIQGVTVLVQADGWPGPLHIEEEVTPLKIRIDNDSGQPVRMRYNEFTLIGPNGASFAALPPSQIESELSVMTDAPGEPYGTGFYHRYFAVAPYHVTLYPNIDPYTGRFPADPYYHSAYYSYWADVDLPTPEMRQRAIPEGVIRSGGSLDGWIFFERVDDDLPKVVFRADLVNADTGRKFAEARIPFAVE